MKRGELEIIRKSVLRLDRVTESSGKQGWNYMKYFPRKGLREKRERWEWKKDTWTFSDRTLCQIFSNFSDRMYRGWRSGSLFTGPFTSKENPGRNKNYDRGSARILAATASHSRPPSTISSEFSRCQGIYGRYEAGKGRGRGRKHRSFAFHSTNWKRCACPLDKSARVVWNFILPFSMKTLRSRDASDRTGSLCPLKYCGEINIKSPDKRERQRGLYYFTNDFAKP